jgi:hypothetical protein
MYTRRSDDIRNAQCREREREHKYKVEGILQKKIISFVDKFFFLQLCILGLALGVMIFSFVTFQCFVYRLFFGPPSTSTIPTTTILGVCFEIHI